MFVTYLEPSEYVENIAVAAEKHRCKESKAIQKDTKNGVEKIKYYLGK